MTNPGISHLYNFHSSTAPIDAMPAQFTAVNPLQLKQQKVGNTGPGQINFDRLSVTHGRAPQPLKLPVAEMQIQAGSGSQGHARLFPTSAQKVQATIGATLFYLQFVPGNQVATLAEHYSNDPLLSIATDPHEFSSFFNSPSSAEVTRRLVDYYKSEHDLAAKLGLRAETLSSTFLYRDQGVVKEQLALEPNLVERLADINKALTAKDHAKLLKHVFGSRVALAPDLSSADAQRVATLLTEVARNEDVFLAALDQLGRTSDVEFGLAPRDTSPHEDAYSFKITKREDTPDVWRVHLSPKAIESNDDALDYTAFAVMKTLETINQVPEDKSMASQYAQLLTNPDRTYIRGLLPPKLITAPDEPILELNRQANSLFGLAHKVDEVYNNKRSTESAKAAIRQRFIEDAVALGRALDAATRKYPYFLQYYDTLQFDAPPPPAPMAPENWMGESKGLQI